MLQRSLLALAFASLAAATASCNASYVTPFAPTINQRATPLQKAPIRGLIDLGQVSAANMPEPPQNTLYYVRKRPADMAGIVVNDTWMELQPNGAGTTIDTSVIDDALSRVARYNRQTGRALGVRLRVWAGIDAPAWAKNIGGPISICDGDAVPKTSQEVAKPTASPTPCPSIAIRTVGAFWSSAYATAWDDLQKQLARKYDGDARVNEVALSSCSSLTSEPFVQPGDSYSRERLTAAHYTDAAYQDCLTNAVSRDYAPWHVTPLAYSFNPFRKIQSKPAGVDLAFTKRTIDGCRTAIGKRCELLNEALAKFTPGPSPAPGQTPGDGQYYYAMWAFMRSRGGAITFQTTSPPNLKSAWGTSRAGWDAAVRLAHQYGAFSLELFPPKNSTPCRDPQRGWINGYTCFPPSVLRMWRNEI